MLHAPMENTIVLPKGALVVVNKIDRFAVNMFKVLALIWLPFCERHYIFYRMG